ncbi:MAG TPA: FAD-dependent oxidoreductase, partial [Trueperaceae bacterium]|nr:FAD-dependent oxidoreductase [Trueperaceae bacterium]
MRPGPAPDAAGVHTRRLGRVAARALAALAVVALALAAAGARAAPGAGAAPPAAGAEPDVNRLGVDVLVYGSEPEAIAAAVAAAEEGARTLLVTPDDRLGGLFVLGELNVLDLKTQPHDFQLGLFDRWWR